MRGQVTGRFDGRRLRIKTDRPATRTAQSAHPAGAAVASGFPATSLPTMCSRVECSRVEPAFQRGFSAPSRVQDWSRPWFFCGAEPGSRCSP